MTDYKTLRVPSEEYHDAKESKLSDETWGEFLCRCTENPPRPRRHVAVEDVRDELLGALVEADFDGMDVDAEVSSVDMPRLVERLDRNYEAAKEATDSAQSAESAIQEVTR